MPETSLSLLERLRSNPDSAAWERFVSIYQPLLHVWLRGKDVRQQDAEDLAQEALATVVRELPEFHYDPQRGTFRGWLRAILANRLRHFWRTRQNRPVALGGNDFQAFLDQLEDPSSAQSRQWDQEHDRFVARRLLDLIRPEFAVSSWQAFQRVVLDSIKARTVADQLGLSINAVFIAKSRVLRRLRQELQGLND